MPRHIDRALLNALGKMGCEVRHGTGKHPRILYKGKFVGPLSTSPSDVRSSPNTLSHVRRAIRKLREMGAVT